MTSSAAARKKRGREKRKKKLKAATGTGTPSPSHKDETATPSPASPISPARISEALGRLTRSISKAEQLVDLDSSYHSFHRNHSGHHRVVSTNNGVLFTQAVSIRPRDQRKPMNWFQRAKTNTPLKIGSKKSSNTRYTWDEAGYDDGLQKQYIFQSKKTQSTVFQKIMNKIHPDDFLYRPNRCVVRYINWSFKSSFAAVFFSFLCVFMFLIFIFGVFIMFAGMCNGQCFIVGGGDFTDTTTGLADGFALSWTTFTTVGYGAVYPATGTEYHRQFECIWINLITTIESFVGLLYAGMCAAILFSKVGRIQSHAQVSFSDGLCIEYGKERGVDRRSPDLPQIGSFGNTDDRNPAFLSPTISSTMLEVIHSGDSDDDDDHMKRRPLEKIYACPVLKFQIVNELCNEPGGEILDASLSCVAKKEHGYSGTHEAIAKFLTVHLEETSHPFFHSVWQGRHILNENSPLLSTVARKRIKMNNGCWPNQWNNPAEIRKHLKFNNLIVTLTGISNISAESVQIAKRFYTHDALIGYDYAPMSYKKEGSVKIKTDMTLINDVIEQYWAPSEIISEHSNTHDHPSLRESDHVKCMSERTQNTLKSSMLDVRNSGIPF